jgi:hypothetical protein
LLFLPPQRQFFAVFLVKLGHLAYPPVTDKKTLPDFLVQVPFLSSDVSGALAAVWTAKWAIFLR